MEPVAALRATLQRLGVGIAVLVVVEEYDKA